MFRQCSSRNVSQVYLSKVSNSATADGSTPFFKIYEDTWAQNTAGGGGSDDYWGTKDLNKHCGKLDVKIPTGLAPGDYLLRAEAIALHAAGSSGGAQVNPHMQELLNRISKLTMLPVLPYLLPTHNHWKRYDQPDRCQLPWRVQGIGPWYPDQHLPEAYQIRLSWTCCHLWRHNCGGWQGWFDSWKTLVSKATLLGTITRCPNRYFTAQTTKVAMTIVELYLYISYLIQAIGEPTPA